MLLTTILVIALIVLALMLIGSGVAFVALFGDIIIWGLIVAVLILLIKRLTKH